MAGILEEFDDATPLRGTYCSRLTTEQYEEQGSQCTGQALEELIEHLSQNPDAYRRVMKRKRRQEAEEAGLLSFMKVKVWTWFAGEDAGYSVSESDCNEELDKLKEGMVKAFDYAEESKGRRFSKRLAEKRKRGKGTPSRLPGIENMPPPPPPPPITPQFRHTLTRRPLTERKGTTNCTIQPASSNSVDCESHKNLLRQLRGSGGRKRLRMTTERSPGGTPVSGWPSSKSQPDILPYFNTKLIEKFRNARSPARSPTVASPGTFESPIL